MLSSVESSQNPTIFGVKPYLFFFFNSRAVKFYTQGIEFRATCFILYDLYFLNKKGNLSATEV